jgi:hypothetical protein
MNILCHAQLHFTVELQIYIGISLYDLLVWKKSKHNSCLQDYLYMYHNIPKVLQ